MNRLLALTMAVLFNCITGSVFGAVLGFSPVVGAVGMNCIATVIGGEVAQGALRAGVYKEVWTGEMVKYLRLAWKPLGLTAFQTHQAWLRMMSSTW